MNKEPVMYQFIVPDEDDPIKLVVLLHQVIRNFLSNGMTHEQIQKAFDYSMHTHNKQ